ncbi:MAG: excinuclease ABC subunit UvrC [Tenericutes bacterium]|nr:excinuclease ABC subunit UvrC [Mycoplasmatota bacterium]
MIQMIKDKLKLLTDKPGCYLMKDINNIVIYVGKAKNLKKRVKSYFNLKHIGKTALLVSNIYDFEFIVTDSELEALLLEINLIKKYEPKYNILLRDDKSYPYIEITNERIPRLIIVRPKNKKKRGKLFGPYPNVYAARKTVEILNRLYPIRKCVTMPKKVCLYYHIEECLGYCEYNINKELIEDMLDRIIKFLNGNHSIVTKKIKEEMNKASLSLNYEKAKEMKDYLEYINVTLKNQHIDFKDNIDRDIFGYYSINNYLSIKVLSIRNGNLVETNSKIYEMIDSLEEELVYYISMFYKDNIKPKEILIPSIVNSKLIEEYTNIKTVIPIKGKKKQLLDMAINNAKISLEQEIELVKGKEDSIVEALNELRNILGIDNINRIEAFDNSHLFGSYSVSGMVVFTLGKPDKKEYRKYKIESNYRDDYNIMKEVIYRRYYRVLMDNLEKPNLIIVDGGKAQISASKEVIESLNLNIPILGLIKDDKHKTNSLLYNNKIITTEKNSNLFHLLERIQDEVHNFTISYHKNIRSKGLVSSILDEIPGIGEKTKKEILTKYKDIGILKELTIEELTKNFNKNIAFNIYEYFKNNN